MDIRTTRMTSPEEKSRFSVKPGTQGELWKEIAEEGYDSLPLPRLKKTTASTAPTAPIIEDGKTLDELVRGNKIGESLTREMRSRGATDQEIWQFIIEN